MACSDQETKPHFNLQDSFKNFRFSSKGASDTGAKCSHGGKKDLLHLQQTTPLNPARPKELRFPSRTLCTRCSSLSWENSLGFYHHPSLASRGCTWIAIPTKPAVYLGLALKGSDTKQLLLEYAHFLSSLRFLKHSL